MYAKLIDNLRKAVPIALVVFGTGAVVCENLRIEYWAGLFEIGIWGCLAVAFGLFAEYLVRAWLFRPNRPVAWYQFTLAGMFIFTTGVAVVCSLFKVLGWSALSLLVLTLLAVACSVEAIQRSRDKSRRR